MSPWGACSPSGRRHRRHLQGLVDLHVLGQKGRILCCSKRAAQNTLQACPEIGLSNMPRMFL